ncbi:phage terminase large subunit family protein [Bradyrhizobium sp. USDA 223]|uniref:phage terminase large subunit family protein n=1 Tax=Bradyrhizobium sp. USDA 223 TaxID=3156306 RepID=UPI00383660D2
MRLPASTAALPGPVRLWPYQHAIADAISDPEIERVTMVKPVRVGFTTLLTGAIGHFVANEPAPILCLLPTDSDARDYMVSDIEPIFEASPALKDALMDGNEEGEDRNTLMSRRFPGGSLKIVAAKSPRNLRRHTARILIIDEADGMEVGKEGNPLRLAERRTLSFANRKIILGSTPVAEDTSHVLRAYEASDQRVFEVPCPSCGVFHEIMWEDIEWPEGHPEEAAFRCPHCRQLISERHKGGMVAAGEWRITKPKVKGHAGFRLNALVSQLANASWAKLAAEYITARNDPAELQTFVNTILGQGWREAGQELDEAALVGRVEPFGLSDVPAEVLVITVGVDVQDDRLEYTVTGWTKDGACLVLGHSIIWGSPDDDLTWVELDELLRTEWRHPYGGKLKVDACAIDSGDGDWTDRVYAYCFPRATRRVMAIKGMSGQRPAMQVSGGKVKGGRLWIVGVDTIKTTIFTRLQRAHGVRFSNTLEAIYFDQLASERRVVRYRRGAPVRSFERIPGKRAESLDCLVYAWAARQALQIPLGQREDDLRKERPSPPQPSVIRSSWMAR